MFNVLAMVAEFEADLIQLRSREGRKLANAKGRLRGKQPKPNQALCACRLGIGSPDPSQPAASTELARSARTCGCL